MVTAFEAIITRAGSESEKCTFKTQDEACAWIHERLAQCPGDARGKVVPVTYGIPSMLEALKNFEPKVLYPGYPGMVPITYRNQKKKIRMIGYLIPAMVHNGATENELIRAIKHSMVLLDAEKYGLNWEQSEKDHGIKELINKYLYPIRSIKEKEE